MITRITVAGMIYGLLSFGAGFVFGTIRELVLIPVFGRSGARLIEFPLMLRPAAVVAAAISRRRLAGAAAPTKLAVGIIGVILLVTVESSFALGVLHRPASPGGGIPRILRRGGGRPLPMGAAVDGGGASGGRAQEVIVQAAKVHIPLHTALS